jgi:hypothetical protein
MRTMTCMTLPIQICLEWLFLESLKEANFKI